MFCEVFKSVDSGVLVVVVNHHGLTESEFRVSLIDTRVLLIANWKRVVAVDIDTSTSAMFTLTDNPEARLLVARCIVLIYRPKSEERDAKAL